MENLFLICLVMYHCKRRSRRKGSSTKSSEVKKLSTSSFHEYLYMILIFFLFVCLLHINSIQCGLKYTRFYIQCFMFIQVSVGMYQSSC